MTKKVVIVEALSTGFNYIQDCIERGLEPVILEVACADKNILEFMEQLRHEKYAKLTTKVQTLREAETYEKTLEMVRALNPILVVPGAEYGVVLATRLADDLGLPGTPYSYIDKMTNKFYTHEALKAAGVRHIRGKICKTQEEAEKFYDELDNEKVVIKPPHGCCSMGVRICNNKEEFVKTFAEQINQVGYYGDAAEELLVQERIVGTEYIVNTLSIEGTHKVTSVWKYEKKVLDNGSNVYVGIIAIDNVSPEAYALVKYAFQVLDAVGIKQGPVHGEFMIDEKGPVLIETNCRCMGSSYPAKFGDQIFSHHETDVSLDSYLNPGKALESLSRPYKAKKYAVMKCLVTPKDTPITNSPILGILPCLKSFYSCGILTSANFNDLPKTVDLETSSGTIYMLHEDYAVLQQEYELLNTLESNYFGLLYQEKYNATLGALPTISAKPDSLDEFEITLRHLKDYPQEDMYHYLKQVIQSLKKGGKLSVSQEAYEEFPYSAAGMVMILRIMGMTVQLPEYENNKLIAEKQ